MKIRPRRRCLHVRSAAGPVPGRAGVVGIDELGRGAEEDEVRAQPNGLRPDTAADVEQDDRRQQADEDRPARRHRSPPRHIDRHQLHRAAGSAIR